MSTYISQKYQEWLVWHLPGTVLQTFHVELKKIITLENHNKHSHLCMLSGFIKLSEEPANKYIV